MVRLEVDLPRIRRVTAGEAAQGHMVSWFAAGQRPRSQQLVIEALFSER